jgi:geranylgeranyl reductase family protein
MGFIMYDALIVGAGPSGSTAARYIASKGLNALVLEKNKLGREKACGGGITDKVIDEFAVPDVAFDRMIYGYFLCSPGNVTVTLEKPYRIGACTMRGKFDKVLCDIAMDRGAEFREESKVIEPLFKNKALIGIRCKELGEIVEYKAKVTIIADGSSSEMTKKLGLYVGDPHAIFYCYQHHMKLDNSKIDERIGNNIEMYFGSDICPIGYAWIFPKDNVVSVGVGTPLNLVKEQTINLRRRLENFIRHHPIAQKKLKGAEKLISQAAMLPYGSLGNDENRIVTKISGNGYLIVGDAAGFVSPATGEGIYYSMKSGKLAAETVVQSLKDNTSEKILGEYERKIRCSVIYRDMKNGWNIRRMFFESDKYDEEISDITRKDPWYVRGRKFLGRDWMPLSEPERK